MQGDEEFFDGESDGLGPSFPIGMILGLGMGMGMMGPVAAEVQSVNFVSKAIELLGYSALKNLSLVFEDGQPVIDPESHAKLVHEYTQQLSKIHREEATRRDENGKTPRNYEVFANSVIRACDLIKTETERGLKHANQIVSQVTEPLGSHKRLVRYALAMAAQDPNGAYLETMISILSKHTTVTSMPPESELEKTDGE